MLGCVLFRGCSCFYAAEDCYGEGVFPVEALERLTEEACRRSAANIESDEKRANLRMYTIKRFNEDLM